MLAAQRNRERCPVTANPLDLISVAHQAFRHDIDQIDKAAAAAARGEHDLDATIDRFRFFGEMLTWHAEGEDAGIFPALAPVAPFIVTAYELDHRGLDLALDGLTAAVEVRDAIEIARSTAAFKFHLEMHLYKEDVDLYPVVAEKLSPVEQARAVGVFTDALPVDRFGDFVRWLFPLVDTDERVGVARVWHEAMPTDVFAGSMRLVERTIGDEFSDLAARMPELADITS
jgi:hemerythrin-like domain-containing protein